MLYLTHKDRMEVVDLPHPTNIVAPKFKQMQPTYFLIHQIKIIFS